MTPGLDVKFGILLRILRRERLAPPATEAALPRLAERVLAREGDWFAAEAALYDLAEAAFSLLAARTAELAQEQPRSRPAPPEGEGPFLWPALDGAERRELDRLVRGLVLAFDAYGPHVEALEDAARESA